MPLFHSRQPEDKSDAALIEGCLAGEECCWRILIARYQDFLMRVPLRFGLSRADAEDVFQNVCLKLCLYMETIEDPKRLAGWLGAVARQESLRVLRKPRGEALPLELPTREPTDPETILMEEERLQELRRSLAELGDECRKLLTLLYGPEPVGYAEAAEALGRPVGSIGPSRARCLETLRKKMKKLTR